MHNKIDNRYPSIEHLRKRAVKKTPKFAFDYLKGGCLNENGLQRNIDDINKVRLQPQYIKEFSESNLSVEIFGHTYDAPFGVAPVGLQGLMAPNSPVILAKSAMRHNVPFILSTVSSEKLETIADITQGNAWYQLYNPTIKKYREDMIRRVKESGYKTLVVTVDVPTFGYRYNDMINGLSMPPKNSIQNFLQAVTCPLWGFKTLYHGVPTFQNLLPYLTGELKHAPLAEFMNIMAMGKTDIEGLKEIRDLWDGNLVIKGVMCETDVKQCIQLGADGVIVSNHGARQLDVATGTLSPTKIISDKYGDKIIVMTDSGYQTGSDIAVGVASGAKMCFVGRGYMYGVCALGARGGDQVSAILKTQLKQVVDQLKCENIADLSNHLYS